MNPRTLLRAVALATGIAVVATGCASGAADSAPEGNTRTFADTYLGTVTDIPAEPTRIASLWRTGAILADLGVVPVAQLEGEIAKEELTNEQWQLVQDVPSIGAMDDIDLDELIAAAPDLIIGMDHGGLPIDYEALQEIAPVLVLNIDEPTDVWRNYPVVADAVNRTDGYEEQLAELDSRIAALGERYGDQLAGLTVTDLGGVGDEIWVSTSKSLVYERLHAVGFGYNAAYTDNPARYGEQLAFENLPSLADQDVIFYAQEFDGSVHPDTQRILDEPAFRALPAAEAGRAFPLRGSVVYTFEAQHALLDDLETTIAALGVR